jgi:ubiquitin carboxyl-terminal hydrolase L3
MVPSPVKAVLLLFPITPASEAAKALEDATPCAAPPASLYFMQQTVDNACGTVGLLHACLNNAADLPGAADSWIAGFARRTAELGARERALALEADEALDEAHAGAAAQGQSAQPDEVRLHFVCFVQNDGQLWELDGRRPKALARGPSSPETLLRDAVAVIKGFMARAEGDVSFNAIALAPVPDDE